MATITQGDQYLIPVLIRQGETVITDQIASGVKVAIDTAVCEYPNGNLTFANGLWWFPLTQKISNALPEGKADFQVQVKINEKIIGTKKKKVDVDGSIIKGEWE